MFYDLLVLSRALIRSPHFPFSLHPSDESRTYAIDKSLFAKVVVRLRGYRCYPWVVVREMGKMLKDRK